MELLDFVAAKFHEEGGVFKLLVSLRDRRKKTLKPIIVNVLRFIFLGSDFA